MLSRAIIKNFKSIGEPGVDLELKPLTLLVGPNGSGKSSILEAIAVASQGGFSGRLVGFPSWESVVPRWNVESLTEIIDIYFDLVELADELGFRGTVSNRNSLNIKLLTDDETKKRAAEKLKQEFDAKTFLISSVRGSVPYSSSVGAGFNPEWVGVNGQHLTPLMVEILGGLEYQKIADKIVEWAKKFGMEGIRAGLRKGIELRANYRDDKLRSVHDLALASSGSRQILTVITQLFWSPEGSLLMIEEPEISLHPQAQVDVLEMFGEAIREGNKQIIATTHSIFMLQALGYAALKGWITPEQMAVYHVEKGEGGTTAALLPLDEKGYIQDWVPSFTEVERHLLLEWAKTLPRE